MIKMNANMHLKTKMNCFIQGFTSIFSLKPDIQLSESPTLFMDSKKSLQQQYWELTASHIKKQIDTQNEKD